MRSWKPVFIFIVIVKSLLFMGFLLKENPHYIEGFWGSSMDSDELTYIDPIDNWLSTGEYQPDFRMPGYGVVYLLFRLFFSRAISCNFIIFVQLLVDILSTYYLGMIAFKIFKSQFAFILTVILYTLSFSVTYSTIFIETESLTVGACIFSTYLYLKYLETKKMPALLFSSLLMTWAIFIRPIVGVFWVAQIFYLLIYFFRSDSESQKFRTITLTLMVYCAPFIALDSAWIIRNYMLHKEFIPLMRPAFGSTTDLKGNALPFLNEFVTAWGGSFTWWDPDAEIRWFGRNERRVEYMNQPQLNTTTKNLPDYIYTSRFNEDSLLIIRERIGQIIAGNPNEQKHAENMFYVTSRLREYRTSIIKEKPLLYYVLAPLMITKKLILKHGTARLFLRPYSELNLFQKLIKIFFSGLYVSVVVGGFIGITLILLRGQFFSYQFLCVSYVLLYVFILTFIFRTDQGRYMIVVYPFLLLCFVHLLVSIKSFVSRQNFFNRPELSV